MSYESPIELLEMDICSQLGEIVDNAITCEISRQLAISINKDELLKALSYDRGQYYKGYSDGKSSGYNIGECVGYILGLQKALELIKSLDYPEGLDAYSALYCNGFCACIRKASEELEKLIKKEQEND